MQAPLSTCSVISSPSRLGLACAGQAHLNPLGKCMSFRSVSASMSMSALSSRSRPPGVLVVRSRRRPLRILVVLVRPQRRVRLCSSARTRSHHTCALQRSSRRHSPDAPRALDVDVASKPRVQAPLRRAPPMRRSCSIWTCYRCCLRRFAVLPRVAHAQGVVRVRGHRAIIPVARQSHRHIVRRARHTHTHTQSLSLSPPSCAHRAVVGRASRRPSSRSCLVVLVVHRLRPAARRARGRSSRLAPLLSSRRRTTSPSSSPP